MKNKSSIKCECGVTMEFQHEVPCSICEDDDCTHSAGLWQCPSCGEEVERWWLNE